MKRVIISYSLLGLVSLAAFVFAGCATHAKGNYLKDPSPSINSYLAKDSVAMLQTAYPPAKTAIIIKPVKETDVFGLTLVENLHLAGYAVYESDRIPPIDDIPTMNDQIDLKYVVDCVDIPSVDENDLSQYVTRVALFVGNDTFTRAYKRSGEILDPVGLWAFGRWLNG